MQTRGDERISDGERDRIPGERFTDLRDLLHFEIAEERAAADWRASGNAGARSLLIILAGNRRISSYRCRELCFEPDISSGSGVFPAFQRSLEMTPRIHPFVQYPDDFQDLVLGHAVEQNVGRPIHSVGGR